MKLYDAHNHLQDRRLDPYRDEALTKMEQIGVVAAVVNGTEETDWEAVALLAAAHPWVRPSFGLHPWYVATRSNQWHEELVRRLDADPGAVIGEIGLDRWIEGHDLALQTEVFTRQLALAAERNLPASIHCLKAWGALWDVLRGHPVPHRGFLLHSYGGPAEMVEGFVRIGAYFSFSPYFLRQRRERQREVFRHIPIERLLIETDAPDMAPPDERNLHPLRDPVSGEVLNHPANLDVAYHGVAELRGIPLENLVENTEVNFLRLFGT
jgi:TatD DNase family protein